MKATFDQKIIDVNGNQATLYDTADSVGADGQETNNLEPLDTIQVDGQSMTVQEWLLKVERELEEGGVENKIAIDETSYSLQSFKALIHTLGNHFFDTFWTVARTQDQTATTPASIELQGNQVTALPVSLNSDLKFREALIEDLRNGQVEDYSTQPTIDILNTILQLQFGSLPLPPLSKLLIRYNFDAPKGYRVQLALDSKESATNAIFQNEEDWIDRVLKRDHERSNYENRTSLDLIEPQCWGVTQESRLQYFKAWLQSDYLGTEKTDEQKIARIESLAYSFSSQTPTNRNDLNSWLDFTAKILDDALQSLFGDEDHGSANIWLVQSPNSNTAAFHRIDFV